MFIVPFRASIWWKYLDGESVLPPPFTIFYLAHKLIQLIYEKIAEVVVTRTAKYRHGSSADVESPTLRKRREMELKLAADKSLFEKRYTQLVLMLTSASERDKLALS